MICTERKCLCVHHLLVTAIVCECVGWCMSCFKVERVLSTAACCHSHLRESAFWWELMYSDIHRDCPPTPNLRRAPHRNTKEKRISKDRLRGDDLAWSSRGIWKTRSFYRMDVTFDYLENLSDHICKWDVWVKILLRMERCSEELVNDLHFVKVNSAFLQVPHNPKSLAFLSESSRINCLLS